MVQERLQKILARAGVSSRRSAEQLITGGRVRVNGAVVSELGARADIETDRIEVDGKAIGREEHVYYMIHKPRGMVTTLRDPEDRPSLSELLHGIPERVYPVGRLDFHTSGALLLTNDGDLAQALLHPSKAVPKTYVVKLSRPVDDWMLNTLSTGVKLDDGYVTAPARVEHLRDEDGKSWLQITITEGKNRQIHRMIEALDTRVMRLSRISFAGITTEDLRPGNIRPLHPDEVALLKREYMTPVAKQSSQLKPLGERLNREYAQREQRERVVAADRRETKRAAPKARTPQHDAKGPAATGKPQREVTRAREATPAKRSSKSDRRR
jgi:23S rRNA pseudouridine2605 synthase